MGSPEFSVMNDQQRSEYAKGQRLRQVIPLILWLHKKNLRMLGVCEEDANRACADAKEHWTNARRNEIREFVNEQITIFRSNAERANPGARESTFAFAMRRQTLLSQLLSEFTDCESGAISEVVNAYIDVEGESTQHLLSLTAD